MRPVRALERREARHEVRRGPALAQRPVLRPGAVLARGAAVPTPATHSIDGVTIKCLTHWVYFCKACLTPPNSKMMPYTLFSRLQLLFWLLAAAGAGSTRRSRGSAAGTPPWCSAGTRTPPRRAPARPPETAAPTACPPPSSATAASPARPPPRHWAAPRPRSPGIATSPRVDAFSKVFETRFKFHSQEPLTSAIPERMQAIRALIDSMQVP